VHARLSTLAPIRAALISPDIHSDTKFGPSESRETFPLSLLNLHFLNITFR